MSESDAVSAVYTYKDGKKESAGWCVRGGVVAVEFGNGDKYVGHVSSSRQREGKGKYTYVRENEEGEQQISVYEGSWKGGAKHGIGHFVYPNGDSYQGMWANGKKSGQGTFQYANGDVYSGEWVDDVKHGSGAYVFHSPSSQLVGTWINGECVRGKWVHSDTSSFHGQFADGKPISKGVYYFSNGLKLEGEYAPEQVDEEEQADESAVQTRQFTSGKMSKSMCVASDLLFQNGHQNQSIIDDEEFVVVTKGGNNSDESKEADVDHAEVAEAEKSVLETLFESIDADHSGKITLAEISAALASNEDGKYDVLITSAPSLTNSDIHDAFLALDSDHDGMMDLGEFKEYFYVLKLFHFVDADESGKVRHAELFQAISSNPELFPSGIDSSGVSRVSVSTLLSKGDADDDRSLDLVEFLRLLAEVDQTA